MSSLQNDQYVRVRVLADIWAYTYWSVFRGR